MLKAFFSSPAGWAVIAVVIILIIYMMWPKKKEGGQLGDSGNVPGAGGQYQSNTTGTGITNAGTASQVADTIKPPTVQSSPKDLYFAEIYKLPHVSFPMKIGAYGQEVAYLQYFLKELGYPLLVVDAKMGTKTMTAANDVAKTTAVSSTGAAGAGGSAGLLTGGIFPTVTKAEYEDLYQQYLKKKT